MSLTPTWLSAIAAIVFPESAGLVAAGVVVDPADAVASWTV